MTTTLRRATGGMGRPAEDTLEAGESLPVVPRDPQQIKLIQNSRVLAGDLGAPPEWKERHEQDRRV